MPHTMNEPTLPPPSWLPPQPLGAFVIWTEAGTPVLNGVAPSPYTNNMGPDAAMHAVRTACTAVARVLGATHPLACASWMHPRQAAYVAPFETAANHAAAWLAALRRGGTAKIAAASFVECAKLARV